jgi:hypothetical protein
MEAHPGTLHDVPQNDEPTAFDAATAIRRTEGGGLMADLDPGWDVGGGILNGGYLLSVVGRAAVQESPHPTRSPWRPATCARRPPDRPRSPSCRVRPGARWPTR